MKRCIGSESASGVQPCVNCGGHMVWDGKLGTHVCQNSVNYCKKCGYIGQDHHFMLNEDICGECFVERESGWIMRERNCSECGAEYLFPSMPEVNIQGQVHCRCHKCGLRYTIAYPTKEHTALIRRRLEEHIRKGGLWSVIFALQENNFITPKLT